MRNKLKYICIVIGVFFTLSFSYNFYQYKKIKDYKEELKTNVSKNLLSLFFLCIGLPKELKTNVSKNLQNFAGVAGNIDNETAYSEQYASIVAAQESYLILSDNNGIPSEEWSSSLPGLFIEIKSVMLNDKEKFEKSFKGTGASELIFKISDNFEDKDSISKIYELLIK